MGRQRQKQKRKGDDYHVSIMNTSLTLKKTYSAVFQLYLPIKILLKIHKGYFSGIGRMQKR